MTINSNIDAAMISKILNATLPTSVGTAGAPTAFTALGATAMLLRLDSGTSTASSAGTQIASGGGYVTGGTAFGTSSAVSSAGSAVTMPTTTAISWTNSSGSAWSIVSLDITDSAGLRTWWGLWNGQPIGVAIGNTFQVATGAISAVFS